MPALYIFCCIYSGCLFVTVPSLNLSKFALLSCSSGQLTWGVCVAIVLLGNRGSLWCLLENAIGQPFLSSLASSWWAGLIAVSLNICSHFASAFLDSDTTQPALDNFPVSVSCNSWAGPPEFWFLHSLLPKIFPFSFSFQEGGRGEISPSLIGLKCTVSLINPAFNISVYHWDIYSPLTCNLSCLSFMPHHLSESHLPRFPC